MKMGSEHPATETTPLFSQETSLSRKRPLMGAACVLAMVLIVRERWGIAAVLPYLQAAEYNGLSEDLSDVQAGFVQGAQFLPYLIMAPITGYLGDRMNRVIFISISLALLAGASVATSFVTTYTQLVVVRLLSGFCEAGVYPLLPNMMSDLFSDKRRRYISGIMSVCYGLGGAIAFIIGNEICLQTGTWRWTYRISPGIFPLLAIFTHFYFEDPPRGLSDGVRVRSRNEESGTRAAKKDLSVIFSTRSFIWSTFGYTFLVFSMSSLFFWFPTLLMRCATVERNAGSFLITHAGTVVGICIAIGSTLGGAIGTVLAYCVASVDLGRRMQLATLAAFLMAASTTVGIMFVSTRTWGAVPFFVVACSAGFMAYGPIVSVLGVVVSAHRRATALAWRSLLGNILGDALGPLVVACVARDLFNDQGLSSIHSLSYALFAAVIASLIAAASLAYGLRYIQPDTEYIAQRQADENEWADHAHAHSQDPHNPATYGGSDFCPGALETERSNSSVAGTSLPSSLSGSQNTQQLHSAFPVLVGPESLDSNGDSRPHRAASIYVSTEAVQPRRSAYFTGSFKAGDKGRESPVSDTHSLDATRGRAGSADNVLVNGGDRARGHPDGSEEHLGSPSSPRGGSLGNHRLAVSRDRTLS
eukprot:Opistho-2@15870